MPPDSVTIDGVAVTCTLKDITPAELAVYVEKAKHTAAATKEHVTTLNIAPGENNTVVLNYNETPPKFKRIRRITGYLVGDVERFNDAKRAELNDRVKHC